jgi:hypothetical protein
MFLIIDVKIKVLINEVKVLLTTVRYPRSGRSALGWRLVHRCSENNVRKLKNRYKFTWFVAAKIRKWKDRCILHIADTILNFAY